MRLTYKMLEQQNKALRTRLSNAAAKAELKEQELLERITVQNKEMGSLPGQVSMLQEYTSKLEREIIVLKAEIELKEKENNKLSGIIEGLKLLIGKLRAKLAKDSSTSDKPPSTDAFRKPKPANSREKSGRKPGGQPGHPGRMLKLFEDPTEVIEKRPITCSKCGHDTECGQEYIARQKVDIKFTINIIEERSYESECPHCGQKDKGIFSEGFNNPVQYGENLKSAVAMISEHGCVSVSKTAEIINSLSGDILSISWGTVTNIQRELSNKLEDTIDTIKAGLCAGEVIGADETGCRVNGSLSWIQVFCNDRFTLFGLNAKRGDIDSDMGILTYFTGILVHDHFSSYYNYNSITHAECNEHILRNIKSLIEIFKHNWLIEMSDLLKSACHEKNELVRAGEAAMPEEAIVFLSELANKLANAACK